MLAIVLKYLPLLQIAAVIVASGILTLGITRELFENEKYISNPPGGLPPVEYARLKYTSLKAARARKYFQVLAGLIYLLLFTLLACLFIFVASETVYQLIYGTNGATDAGCFGNGLFKFFTCETATVADAAGKTEPERTFPVGVLMFYLMLFGAALTLGLGMAVRVVVDIRANHR